ncbi:hypothetical protein [Herbaspirillum autotrophicum]|uniref:hypothetical protein n=1 Tax=Herbaspirillum autotrophicum TaxID=180195 RepID=UPI00067A7CF4|nr:hypothetical protein [Herbaspirillum autotrophicum]
MKNLRPSIEYKRLQELSRTNSDPVVQELLWEIRRLHFMLSQDLQDIIQIRMAWAQEVGGNYAAIHQMLYRLKSDPASFDG